MGNAFCPGTKLIRQPTPEVIKCASCKGDVEIWSDELRVNCPHCHQAVVRKGPMSCLEWCTMGKECVGEEAYGKFVEQRSLNIKQQILTELENYFGTDAKRIAHAKAVLCAAEELLQRGGGDWHIVVPTAILHDVGIKVAEEKYGSSAGNYQEVEGPPIVRKILLKVGLRHEHIDEICAIVAHHHSPGKDETLNFQMLYDADGLVNIQESIGGMDTEQKKVLIEKQFLTAAGREIAAERFLK